MQNRNLENQNMNMKLNYKILSIFKKKRKAYKKNSIQLFIKFIKKLDQKYYF